MKKVIFRRCLARTEGSVLIFTLMLLTILMVLGTAAMSIASTEYRITGTQTKRTAAQFDAESVVEEAVYRLKVKLREDPFYLPGSDMSDEPSDFSVGYKYTAVYEGVYTYRIKIEPIQHSPNKAVKVLEVRVRGNPVYETVYTNFTGVPAAFQTATYVNGNINATGNATFYGPIHAQANPNTGAIGTITLGGSSLVHNGPITTSAPINQSTIPSGSYSSTVIGQIYSASMPSPTINPSLIVPNYFPTESVINPEDLPTYPPVVIKTTGDLEFKSSKSFGNRQVLIYTTGNVILKSDTGSLGNVAIIAGGKVTITSNLTFYGIIYGGSGVEITGSPTIYGSVVSNNSSFSAGSATIYSNPGVAQNLVTQFGQFIGQATVNTSQKTTIPNVQIISWNEEN